MEILIHVIHPYTYNIVGNTLEMGPIEQYAERDQKVAHFLQCGLDAEARILHYRDAPKDTIRGALVNLALEPNVFYKALSDPRVDDTIITTLYGVPIPDECPPQISKEDRELYELYHSIFTTRSQLQQKLGTPSATFFIGGALEACVGNMAEYYDRYYRKNGERAYYIPELCASFNEQLRQRREERLASRSIERLTYDQALAILNA